MFIQHQTAKLKKNIYIKTQDIIVNSQEAFQSDIYNILPSAVINMYPSEDKDFFSFLKGGG